MQSAASGKSVPLFSMMRAEPLQIVVDIPESDAGWMRPGLAATLSVDGIKGYQCKCVVQRVAEMLDPKTHAMRVELEVADGFDGLRPGMYGVVTITNERATRTVGIGPTSLSSPATD